MEVGTIQKRLCDTRPEREVKSVLHQIKITNSVAKNPQQELIYCNKNTVFIIACVKGPLLGLKIKLVRHLLIWNLTLG